MPIKFTDVFTRTDWVKIGILAVIATVCWVWVYKEFQKPIIPPEWAAELDQANKLPQ